MKRNILILIFIVSCFILSGCTESATNNKQSKVTTEEKNITSYDKLNNDKDREYIVDEDASEWFKELYQMNNLENHKVFITDDTLHISFWFNNNVKRQEILNGMSYVMKNLALKDSGIGAIPYGGVISKDYTKLELTVYINDSKLLEQNFSNIGRGNGSIEIDYYENLDTEFISRTIHTRELEEFTRKVKWNYWSIKDVIFEKTYKGTVLAVKLKGRKEYNEDEIIKIKRLIEENLDPKVDALGIVLQLYSGNKKYYEETYHSNDDSNNKYWFKEYWGNHNYFDFNN